LNFVYCLHHYNVNLLFIDILSLQYFLKLYTVVFLYQNTRQHITSTMAGVTWGSNTVHNIGANPAPASTFGFGSTTATPSPAPGGSLFGTPTPSYSTSAFGAAAHPQPQSKQQYVPQQQIPAQAAMQASCYGCNLLIIIIIYNININIIIFVTD
jgi:hypothetical protein